HLDDGLAGVITEKLAFVLLMKTDAVLSHQFQKILRGIARQGRTAKMRVFGQKILWRSTRIGEVTAPSTGNTDFLGQLFSVINQYHSQAALACDTGSHHTGRTCADDGNIKKRDHAGLLVGFRLKHAIYVVARQSI